MITNNTVGKMKMWDPNLKKVVIIQQGDSYKIGSASKEQVVARPKAPSNKEFKEELTAIKGIGKETVRDIINIYPTKAHLISAIRKGDDLSFRNDVVSKLKKKYQEVL